jgi:hypothetical protein
VDELLAIASELGVTVETPIGATTA